MRTDWSAALSQLPSQPTPCAALSGQNVRVSHLRCGRPASEEVAIAEEEEKPTTDSIYSSGFKLPLVLPDNNNNKNVYFA